MNSESNSHDSHDSECQREKKFSLSELNQRVCRGEEVLIFSSKLGEDILVTYDKILQASPSLAGCYTILEVKRLKDWGLNEEALKKINHIKKLFKCKIKEIKDLK